MLCLELPQELYFVAVNSIRMSASSRREFLAAVSVVSGTSGCIGTLWPDEPTLSTEGAVTRQWRVDHEEPVRSIRTTSDRIYVATKASGPSDGVSLHSSSPAYMGALSALSPGGETHWQTEFSTRVWGDLTPTPHGVYLVTGRGTMTGPREKQFRKVSLSGEKRWTTPKRDAPVSLIDRIDGTMFLGLGGREESDATAQLVAIRPDGRRKWVRSTSAGFFGRASVDGTLVVYSRKPSRVVAYEATTGEQKWQWDDVESPQIVGDSVYATNGKSVTAVDTHTGEPRWTTSDGVEPLPDPDVVATRAMVLVVNKRQDDPVIALDPADGTRLWESMSQVGADRAVPFEDTVAISVGGTVNGIDGSDGTPLWQRTLDGGRLWISRTDERLLASTFTDDTRIVTALDPTDGERLWRVEGDLNELVIGEHGIYAGGESGAVWKLLADG